MVDQITREKNIVHAHSLSEPAAVGGFFAEMQAAYNEDYREFVIDFCNVEKAFPNVGTPIAGAVQFYASQRRCRFEFTNVSESVRRAWIVEPRRVSDFGNEMQTSPMNTVWCFTSSADVNRLTSGFVAAVAQAAVCGPGTLDALDWSINEVMDNVLQHSLVDRGFVMGQIHRNTTRVAICVFDYGQGIFKSLKESHHPRSAVEAIEAALREGVTRDSRIGQGNGLWGLHNIVKQNSGQLNIISGPGRYSLTGDDVTTAATQPFLDRDNESTRVDIQIDFSKGIALSQALGGFQPVNHRTESIQDDSGTVVFRLIDKASGRGTRKSGEALRNEVINLAGQSPALIVLDFEEVSVVSSSFADEFVGKLVATFGFIAFTQRFRLANMNPTVEAVVNRSVSQRMGEIFKARE
jgi:hypothetical protein